METGPRSDEEKVGGSVLAKISERYRMGPRPKEKRQSQIDAKSGGAGEKSALKSAKSVTLEDHE
jgi:hypothetical protein